MQPANLVSLPIELIQHIGSFLSASDLLSCSESCHYLRSALNSNGVWKRFLSEQDLSSLESLNQQVFPQHDSLSPLCPNRLQLVHKSRLINNWRKGNFQMHKVYTKFAYGSGDGSIKSGGQMIYKNKYAFVICLNKDFSSNGIEVWDISSKPILYTCLIVSGRGYFHYYIVGSNLMIIDCCKVDVYQITLPEKDFPLLYSFLVKDESTTIGQYAQHPPKKILKCRLWNHYVANQYLLSSMSREGILYIWDIFSASKFGSFSLPKPHSPCSLITVLKNQLFLSQYVLFRHVYFYFNLEERKLSDAVFYHASNNKANVLAYDSNVIIILDDVRITYHPETADTVCKVYNFNTSKELNRRIFHSSLSYDRSSMTIFNGKFVLHCVKYFLIVNALSLEIVAKIPYDVQADVITHQFNVFGSLIVVTKGEEGMLQLWDIQRRRRLGQLGDLTHDVELYLNDNCSALLCIRMNELSVFNFG